LTADTVRVAILDSGFSPERIRVRVGTTVLWVGEGDLPHSTVSNSELWESPLMTAGESYQRIFREAGEYAYHCTLHPTMTGVIVVEGG
jgi:plastocyanin